MGKEYDRRKCKKEGCSGVSIYLGWAEDRIINEIPHEAYQCPVCGNISYKVPKVQCIDIEPKEGELTLEESLKWYKAEYDKLFRGNYDKDKQITPLKAEVERLKKEYNKLIDTILDMGDIINNYKAQLQKATNGLEELALCDLLGHCKLCKEKAKQTLVDIEDKKVEVESESSPTPSLRIGVDYGGRIGWVKIEDVLEGEK